MKGSSDSRNLRDGETMIRGKFPSEELFFLLVWGLVPVLAFIMGMTTRIAEGNSTKLSAAIESREDGGKAFENVRTEFKVLAVKIVTFQMPCP